MWNILSFAKLFLIVNCFKIVSGIISTAPNALDCELSFGSLDGGSNIRIGLIHTSSQAETTTLVDAVKAVLKVCGNVQPEDIFEESVSNEFDIPITAKFLSMSEYVDAIIVIVDYASHLTTSNDAKSIATMQGIVDIELHSYVPIIFRSVPRSSYNSSPQTSAYDIGKTAVEMALARWEALDAIAEFEYVETRTGFVGGIVIVLLLLLIVGFVLKKRGMIKVDRSIFANRMCCKKQYDKVEVATPVKAEITQAEIA